VTYTPRILRLALTLCLAAPVSLAAQQNGRSAAAPLPAPSTVQKAVTREVKLSRLADSLGNYLVFPPIGDTAFVVASRNKRMLVDIGRVDAEVRKDSAKAAAYREAVEKRSPVTVGTKFMLRAPWGVEEVTASGVDVWNGRIVLRITGSATMDSMARGKNTVVAMALVTTGAVGAAFAAKTDSCDRVKPLSPELAARVTFVRDSLLDELRKGPQPLYERLKKKLSLTTSQVTGCFGGTGRVALVASLKAANNEWVREKLVIIDEAGKLTSLRINDLRFRAHELIQAFDADGDGVDDLATRATTERAGATTVLLLDLKGKKLVRFAQGFSWEEM
jgi:hypothetical protein